MASTLTAKNLTDAIGAAVQAEADRLRETAIAKAVAAYEEALRAAIAQTALKVSDYYDLERDRGQLLIRVRIGDAP